MGNIHASTYNVVYLNNTTIKKWDFITTSGRLTIGVKLHVRAPRTKSAMAIGVRDTTNDNDWNIIYFELNTDLNPCQYQRCVEFKHTRFGNIPSIESTSASNIQFACSFCDSQQTVWKISTELMQHESILTRSRSYYFYSIGICQHCINWHVNREYVTKTISQIPLLLDLNNLIQQYVGDICTQGRCISDLVKIRRDRLSRQGGGLRL